jgi:hypothetical protein
LHLALENRSRFVVERWLWHVRHQGQATFDGGPFADRLQPAFEVRALAELIRLARDRPRTCYPVPSE